MVFKNSILLIILLSSVSVKAQFFFPSSRPGFFEPVVTTEYPHTQWLQLRTEGWTSELRDTSTNTWANFEKHIYTKADDKRFERMADFAWNSGDNSWFLLRDRQYSYMKDANGNVTEILEKNFSFNPPNEKRVEYNYNQGRVVGGKEYRKINNVFELLYTSYYKYDSQGNRIMDSAVSSFNPQTIFLTTYEYDGNNRCIKQSNIDISPTLIHDTTEIRLYEYHSDKKVRKQSVYRKNSSTNDIELKSVINYTFTPSGLLETYILSQWISQGQKFDKTHSYTHTYDNQNRLKSWIVELHFNYEGQNSDSTLFNPLPNNQQDTAFTYEGDSTLNWSSLPRLRYLFDEITVGINEFENSIYDKVKVFPNPSYGSFQIELDNYTEKAQINLYSSSGKRIKHFKSEFLEGKSKIKDLNLPSGIYWLSVETSKKGLIGFQKIVIN